MFPITLKNAISRDIISEVKRLDKLYPNKRFPLNTSPLIYGADEYITDEVSKFILENKSKIISNYNKFVLASNLSISAENLPNAIFEYFIEDFFGYAVYKCFHSTEILVTFEEIWSNFEQEFFSDEQTITYFLQLKNLYYHGGMSLDSVLEYNGVKAFFSNEDYLYRILGWEREGNFWKYFDNFYPPWVILSKTLKIGANENINQHLKSFEDDVNLITLVIRCIKGGGLYFNDIRLFGVGNYSPHNTESMRAVSDNDIYEQISEKTTIDNPWDWFIGKSLKKIKNANYNNLLFIDWSIRLKRNQKTSNKDTVSPRQREFYLYNNLVGLTFGFNSLIFDNQNKDNSKFREDYIPTLMKEYFRMEEVGVRKTISDLYKLRNKIAHGHYLKARKIVTETFFGYDNLEKALNGFEVIINRLILLSIVNEDIKAKLKKWYKSGDNTMCPVLIKPFD
ncbi:MAG: hypothetical protein HQK53_18990 [Oligoflexia bacterium]|nr:hypothetical protein [Oligoflexia bacterium]